LAIEGSNAVPNVKYSGRKLELAGIKTLIRSVVDENGGDPGTRGIDLIAADNPTTFLDDGPTSILIRQILGAVAQFEKAMLVAKLKGARDRKRRSTGKKVEGRKSHKEAHPEVVALARSLVRQGRRKMSLRAISAELAAAGLLNHNGKPYAAESISRMLK
jgi:DNA invertase Pin-like site-specific DNA recombinase